MPATPTRLEEVIQAIQTKLKKGFPNEAAVSQGAVLPILQACDWNTHDTDEVYPEYGTQDNQRVDYALLRGGRPLIFIEVKHRLDNDRNLDKGIEQVLNYAYKEGVPVAVLTDGEAWLFYWPAAPEQRYADRLAQAIRLTRTEPTEAAPILQKYLQKSPDLSSNRLRKIIEQDFYLNKLPLLLEEIFQNPPDDLIGLIDKIAKQRDIDIEPEQIGDFLRQWGSRSKLSPTEPIASPIPNTERGQIHEASPQQGASASPSPAEQTAPPNDTPKPPPAYGYYYKGTFYRMTTKQAVDIYVEIIRRLIQDYPNFAERFSNDTAGHRRYYLLRKGEKLPSEDDLEFYREILEGWLVCTNLSNASKHQKLRRAAEIVGLPYDDEKGIKVIGF